MVALGGVLPSAMGALLSRSASGPGAYERILTDISGRIRSLEGRRAALRLREKRWAARLLFYGAAAYAILLAYAGLAARSLLAGDGTSPYPGALESLLAAALVPVGAYYAGGLFRHIFARHIGAIEARLADARALQRAKVEELKRQTAYYATKGLIDRFDGEPDRGGEPDQPVRELSLPSVAETATPSPPTQHHDLMGSQPAGSPPACFGAPLQAVAPARNAPPSWLDRLVDAVLGDEPRSKYALVCRMCHSHNGLVSPEAYDSLRMWWMPLV